MLLYSCFQREFLDGQKYTIVHEIVLLSLYSDFIVL